MIIEIRDKDLWIEAGEINLIGFENDGVLASCSLEYKMDYAIGKVDTEEQKGSNALSCLFDVDLALRKLDKWPSFLLDLFPQGAALKYVVDHYRIADQPQNYWKILNTAVLSPPGNLRVKVARKEENNDHPGFDKTEVIEKGPDFIEYMVQCGAPISGTTGAGGAAPKFLLREDYSGKFHGEGVLPDERTKQSWIVKFPRGDRTQSVNNEILKAEKSWYQIATMVGLKTHGPLEWHPNCLFIPRFDREVTHPKVNYWGLESFYSLIDSVEFGSRFSHETYLDGLHKFSDQKEGDLIEYFLRDLLNRAMGNTDNHGRNQSVLKKGNKVSFSPLYDFAPMKFDPEGIPRNTRWEDENHFLTEAARLFEKKYNIGTTVLKKSIDTFWQKFQNIDFSSFDFNQKFSENLKADQNWLDKKIEQFLGGKV